MTFTSRNFDLNSRHEMPRCCASVRCTPLRNKSTTLRVTAARNAVCVTRSPNTGARSRKPPQCAPDPSRGCDHASERRGHRIGDGNRAALLVRSARVANPSRHRQREMGKRSPGCDPVAHGTEKPLRQLLRTVHSDLLRAVRQRRIAEARHQLRAVRGKVDARRRDERGRDLLGHLPFHEACEMRVGRRLPDRLVPGDEPR